MDVPEAALRDGRHTGGRSRVRLPGDVTEPFEVFVNGVPQRRGADFRVEPGALLFDRSLVREGRLGFWRWTSMVLGIAGSYGRNDTVDVVYDRGGRRVVATGLEVEPLP